MPAVFPIAYFGNIEYYRLFLAAYNPIIEVKEHFIKQTVRTRCEILTANGIQQLSIPVTKHRGSKTPMDEVEISDQSDWRKIHWKAIESAYSSAPFFDHYGMEVEELIYQNETNLIKFELNIMERIDSWLDLKANYICSEEYIGNDISNDLRANDFTEHSPIRAYRQVFEPTGSFVPNLCILDLIFCEGPLARNWLKEPK